MTVPVQTVDATPLGWIRSALGKAHNVIHLKGGVALTH